MNQFASGSLHDFNIDLSVVREVSNKRKVVDLSTASGSVTTGLELLFTIVENIPVALLIVNKHGLIEFANPTTLRLFGYSDRTITGRSLELLFPSHNTFELLPFLFQNGSSSRTTLLTAIKESGESVILEVAVKSLFIAGRQRNLVIMQDVTERNRAENLKNEFMAMASHDLRSPLTSIKLFLQLIANSAFDVLPPIIQEKLGTIERLTDRVLHLVDDLLDLGKLESGAVEMELAPTQIAPVVEASVEAVQNLAEERGIRIAVACRDIEIVANRDRLIQVLVNLLANALAFSPAGSVITVSTCYESESATVTVTDQGRGISRSDQKVIFERYRQVSPSNRGERKRIGLGLPICRAIIEQHQGTMGVDSELGKGSTFWFRIPRRPNN
jgi:PAS domain S-box-containing protein